MEITFTGLKILSAHFPRSFKHADNQNFERGKCRNGDLKY